MVPGQFGDGLPRIGDWAAQHFEFSGYISGFEPADVADRDAIRAELGYAADEKVCVVTVGGSGVGLTCCSEPSAAFPAAKRLVPELRMIVVTGPRIDPAALPARRRPGASAATSTTCTGTWRRATSPWCRAG